MSNRVILFSIALLFSVSLQADDAVLREKLETANAMLEQEMLTNSELRAELAARETEATELRLKLKELEDRIKSLKQEHNIK